MSERLFSIDELPEVPLVRPPRRRKSDGDARFRNDYPPEWNECGRCDGAGWMLNPADLARMGWRPMVIVNEGVDFAYKGQRIEPGTPTEVAYDNDLVTLRISEQQGLIRIEPADAQKCPDCLGMGSLKAKTRLLAGHRCERCCHPYIPENDAAMLGVESRFTVEDGVHWSPCDEGCAHRGFARITGTNVVEKDLERPADLVIADGFKVEAAWRILTVHHLDGDKANCQPYNLAVLCQRDHLEVQSKVIMEQVYPHQHSEWFKWHAAGYYADVYLGLKNLTREQIEERLDEFLALELASL